MRRLSDRGGTEEPCDEDGGGLRVGRRAVTDLSQLVDLLNDHALTGSDPMLASVQLYWLPLGAGDASCCVRWNGRVFEAIAAGRHHRPACDLYHSALMVHLGADRYAIEMAPAGGNQQPDRGVVSEGAVGLSWLGRSRFFRYEIRRWRDGTISDIAYAVASPQRVPTDMDRAQRLLDLVPAFPAVTWGRDELHAGEMWNSNSLIAWLLARSGHQPGAIELPAHGRAPGWAAGLAVAARQCASTALEAAQGGSQCVRDPLACTGVPR